MWLTLWCLVFFISIAVVLYRRMSMTAFVGIAAIELLALIYLIPTYNFLKWAVTALTLSVIIPLAIKPIRRQLITKKILAFFVKSLPNISQTEQDALDAGTVSWDAELFTGKPDWQKLAAIPKPQLSEEEQAFFDGPVEELCRLADDWQITHEDQDLPEPVWHFIKDNGFWSMIIPKQYGGLEFSAYAQSKILAKIFSHSQTLGVTVAVPNSLGPGELLMHYGTDEQKDYYLPRLAKGEEIPCFALTSPDAGSDAASIKDNGIVCKQTFNGKETLGIRLNWDKRYITLAPVASLLGLAFKLYDPDGLLGDKKEYGITCALIPTDIEGVKTGQRHFPLNNPFQNGPTQGKDVFVPIDYIIGGPDMAGNGWRMLMECLSAGRGITLPSAGAGMSRLLTYAGGAYARVRQQFNMPVGYLEGVAEVIARMVSNTYIADATCSLTAAIIDQGEKPPVISAISKYHCTERGRLVVNDAMDVHGGKGIVLGPKNYLGRIYQGVPVAITVEGANILTRSMIIFGQGAMRCHPHLLDEVKAAKLEDSKQQLIQFDNVFFKHVHYSASNFIRSFFLALSGGRFSHSPVDDSDLKWVYQQMNRLSASFAILSDISVAVLGGDIKRREMLSGRLGDIFSALFLCSSVIKMYQDRMMPTQEKAIVRFACQTLLYSAERQMKGVIVNFPNKIIGRLMHAIALPLGAGLTPPTDELTRQVSKRVLQTGQFADFLKEGVFIPNDDEHPVYQLQQAMTMVDEVETLYKRMKKIKLEVLPTHDDFDAWVKLGLDTKTISSEEAELLRKYEVLRRSIVAVDDFSKDYLAKKSVASSDNVAVMKPQADDAEQASVAH